MIGNISKNHKNKKNNNKSSSRTESMRFLLKFSFSTVYFVNSTHKIRINKY